jgi:hypothetical protein
MSGGSQCPSCRQLVRLVPILWGLPAYEGFMAASRGEVLLGGCVVGPRPPTHICPTCDAPVVVGHGGVEVCRPAWLDEPLSLRRRRALHADQH